MADRQPARSLSVGAIVTGCHGPGMHGHFWTHTYGFMLTERDVARNRCPKCVSERAVAHMTSWHLA